MSIKIYDGVGKGENLKDAISNLSRGSYEPRIVTDWVDKQVEHLLEPENDHRAIDNYIDKLNNVQHIIFCDILTQHNIDIEDCFYNHIDRTHFKTWSEEYKCQTKKQLCLECYEYLDNLSDDHKYMEDIYNMAWYDFNLFYEDCGTDDDVRFFFGEKFEIVGYEINGEECDLSEIYICPYCEEPTLIEEQDEAWERHYEEHKKNSTEFVCNECGHKQKFCETKFAELNKHITMQELIAKGV